MVRFKLLGSEQVDSDRRSRTSTGISESRPSQVVWFLAALGKRKSSSVVQTLGTLGPGHEVLGSVWPRLQLYSLAHPSAERLGADHRQSKAEFVGDRLSEDESASLLRSGQETIRKLLSVLSGEY